jgi:hypothetical protein
MSTVSAFRDLLLPVGAIAMSGCIVLFGSREMRRKGAAANGLSTWLFALPPFAGGVFGILAAPEVPAILRVSLAMAALAGIPALSWRQFKANRQAELTGEEK